MKCTPLSMSTTVPTRDVLLYLPFYNIQKWLASVVRIFSFVIKNLTLMSGTSPCLLGETPLKKTELQHIEINLDVRCNCGTIDIWHSETQKYAHIYSIDVLNNLVKTTLDLTSAHAWRKRLSKELNHYSEWPKETSASNSDKVLTVMCPDIPKM